MTLGLLIIRFAVGLTIAAHGAQKLLGWFGGGGIEGTSRHMEHLGLRPGRRAAEMAAAAEVGGGLALALGLLTPFAAAAVLGVMTVAAAVAHAGKGFFLRDGGWEYPFVLAAVAAALAFTGPGDASLDAGLGLRLDGLVWGLVAVVLGLGAAFAQLAARASGAAVDLVEAEADAADPSPVDDDTVVIEREG